MVGKRKRTLRARRDIEERRKSNRNTQRMSYDEEDTTASELSDFASYVQNYARIYSRNPELNDQDSLRLLERSDSPSSASDVVDGQPRARKKSKTSDSSTGDKPSATRSRDTYDYSVSPKSSSKQVKHQDCAKNRLVSPRAAAEALLQAEVISISSTDPDNVQEQGQNTSEDQVHISGNDNAGESRQSIVTNATLVDAEPSKAQQASRPAYTQPKWHSLASISFSVSSGSPQAPSRSNSPQPDVRRSAHSQSISAQSSVRRPAASQSNSPQPDVRQPAASQSISAQQDLLRSAASQSKSAELDVRRSADSQSNSAEPDVRRSAASQPNPAQQDLHRPAAPPATQPSKPMKTPPIAQAISQAQSTQPGILRSNSMVAPKPTTTYAKPENTQPTAQSIISHPGMLCLAGPIAPQPAFSQDNGRHASTCSVSSANLIQPGMHADQRYSVVSTQTQNYPVSQTVAQSSTHSQQSFTRESQRLNQLERTECMQQQNVARASALQVQIMREQLFDVLPQSAQLAAIFNDISHHYRAIDMHYNNIQQQHRLLSKHLLTTQHMLQNHAQTSASRPDPFHHPYQPSNNNAYAHNQHHVMAQQHHTFEREHDRRSLQDLEQSQSMDVARNNQNLIRLSRESFQSLQRSNADVVQPTNAHQTQLNANGMAHSIPFQQNGAVKNGNPVYGSSQAIVATMPPPMPSIQQPAVNQQSASLSNHRNISTSRPDYRVPVSVSTGGNIGMAILEERQQEMASKLPGGRSLAQSRRRDSDKVDEDDMPLAVLRRNPAAHSAPGTQRQTSVNSHQHVTTSAEAMQPFASQQARDLLGAFSPRKVPSMPVAVVQATDHTHPQNAAHTSGIDKNVAAPKMGFRSLPQTSPHPFNTSRGSQPTHGLSSSSQRVPQLPATMTQPDSVPYMAFTAINSGNRGVSIPAMTAAQAHKATTAEMRPPRDDAAAKVQDIQDWVIIDKD